MNQPYEQPAAEKKETGAQRIDLWFGTLLYGYLVCSLLVQGVFFKAAFAQIAGEFFGAILGGAYLLMANMRRGLGEESRMSWRIYLGGSLLATAAVVVLLALFNWQPQSVGIYVLCAAIVFVVTYLLLATLGHFMGKKQPPDAEAMTHQE